MFKINVPRFYFRLSESVADALGNTLIVLPPIVALFHSYRQAGIGAGVGALLINLTDLPGNRRGKAVTALQSLLIFFLASLIFSASLPSTMLTGLVLQVLSMLAALGAVGRGGYHGDRADGFYPGGAAVGTLVVQRFYLGGRRLVPPAELTPGFDLALSVAAPGPA